MKSISAAIVVLAGCILFVAAAMMVPPHATFEDVFYLFAIPSLFLIVATAKWWYTLDIEK